MSDVIESPTNGNAVTQDDLQRMLDETRGKLSVVEQERDSERVARIVTEQDRDQHATRAASEIEGRYRAQIDAVKGSIAATEALVTNAEDAYARHAELGDWKAAAKAQREMADATAKLHTYKQQSDFLETNKERLVTPAARTAQPAPRSGDRIADLVGGPLAPGEREWLSKRETKFVGDERYRAKVFNASNFVTADGHQRGSPQYFREMERILGEEAEEQPRQIERAPSSDLTPQRRAAPGREPSGGRHITLTADQREVADGLYGQPNSDEYIADEAKRYEHYHNNLERMRASGRI